MALEPLEIEVTADTSSAKSSIQKFQLYARDTKKAINMDTYYKLNFDIAQGKTQIDSFKKQLKTLS